MDELAGKLKKNSLGDFLSLPNSTFFKNRQALPICTDYAVFCACNDVWANEITKEEYNAILQNGKRQCFTNPYLTSSQNVIFPTLTVETSELDNIHPHLYFPQCKSNDSKKLNEYFPFGLVKSTGKMYVGGFNMKKQKVRYYDEYELDDKRYVRVKSKDDKVIWFDVSEVDFFVEYGKKTSRLITTKGLISGLPEFGGETEKTYATSIYRAYLNGLKLNDNFNFEGRGFLDEATYTNSLLRPHDIYSQIDEEELEDLD